MKKCFSFFCFVSVCLVSTLNAEEPKTPVPAELKALVEAFVNALKSQDDAAMAACWHSPEVLAKRREAEAQAQSGTSPTEINVAKEREKELKKREKDMTRNKQRIDIIRGLIAKYFGDPAGLKLVELEVDPEEDATEAEPAFDEVELHLTAADGTGLRLDVDDAIRIDGVWKFKGRVENKLGIEFADP